VRREGVDPQREASVRAVLNILVAGATQAGKTTLLNCLAAAIPGGERVVSAEEVFELRFPDPDCTTALCSDGGACSRAARPAK
jgi:Flp pilus assembly CpaF family ATPase